MSDAQTNGMELGGSDGVKVVVEPRVCLHDVPTSIKVTGLDPNAPVTLTLTTHNDQKKKFHSYAHYLSDENGTVDVDKSEAVDGSYKGVFPAGLLSSLQEYPNHYTRLAKDEASTPWLMRVGVHSGHLTREQSVTSGGLDTVLMERHIMGPGVKREPVVHERVRGSVFLPPGPGPHPAVLDILGGTGGLREYRASMLASRGFASLAIAYLKYADLPDVLETLDLEYFEEAIDYLLQQPGVIPDRCGVLCSSKSGNIGLALGIYSPKVTAVTSVAAKFVDETILTHRGREITKCFPMDQKFFRTEGENRVSFDPNVVRKIYSDEGFTMLPCELAPDDTYFLVVHSPDDGTCTYMDAQVMVDRMTRNGRDDHCEVAEYIGTGHVIEMPYNTHAAYSTYDRDGKKITCVWGGNPRDLCKAQVDIWVKMRKFYGLHVRDRSEWYQQHLERLWRERE